MTKHLGRSWLCLTFFFAVVTNADAQQTKLTRLARIVVDSSQLATYNRFLKEEIETSVKLEPGVLTLYAVSDKASPTHITILEIYADSTAYRAHLLTPHFLKYKKRTAAMVTHLELIPVNSLVPDMKIK